MCRLLPRRRGSLTPFLLFAFTVLLALFGLAVNHARLWTIRAEQQRTADAASLAALQILVDDDLLRGDSQAVADLLARARLQAQQYAQFNYVDGQPFALDANAANDAAGDIVIGILE